MRRTTLPLRLLLIALYSAGCVAGETPDYAAGTFSLALAAEQESGVLTLVNDCATTFAVLDLDASLNARAAANIIAHRDGGDGLCGTADDNAFDTLAELDDVPYVGDSALGALLAYATELGLIATDPAAEPTLGTWDGVAFTATEAAGALAVANGATLTELDVDAGLDSRAANNIVGLRPFDTVDLVAGMDALAAVSYVGSSALSNLEAYGATWVAPCAPLGGTFEGVVFDDAEAHDVLDLLNNGADADLDAITGVGATTVGRLTAARPFATLDDFAAVYGIGSSALTHFRDEVGTTWCVTGAASCGCGLFEGATGTGSGSTAGNVYDNVPFTADEEAMALEIANLATDDQLIADGAFTAAYRQNLIAFRPYTSLAEVATISGWGEVAMNLLHTYATSGRWQGEGILVNVVTVAEVLAAGAAWNGRTVHLDRITITWTSFDPGNAYGTTWTAYARDPNGGDTVRLFEYLCNYMTEACDPFPATVSVGDATRLLRVEVQVDTAGTLTLSIDRDTSKHAKLGCDEGWTRSCGMDVGVCSVGTETCNSDAWSACTGLVNQTTDDVCDGLDNDCDGTVDENGTGFALVGTFPVPVQSWYRRGTHAYAMNSSDHLSLDLTDPAHPVLLETRPRVDPRGAVSVHGSDRWTAMADCVGVVEFYAAGDTTLTPRHVVSVPGDLGGGCVQSVAFDGDLAYVANSSTGLTRWDLSGATPVKTWENSQAGYQQVHRWAGHLLALTQTGKYLESWAVGAATPTRISVHSVGLSAYQSAMTDAGLVLVTDTNDFSLFDAADPAAVTALPAYRPTTVGVIATKRLFAAGEVVARIGGSYSAPTLVVTDFSDPSAPVVLGELEGATDLGAFDGESLVLNVGGVSVLYTVSGGCL